MKRSRFTLYLGGAVIGILAGGGLGLAATASVGSTSFVTEDEISAEWRSVTSQSELRFPEGKGFSPEPPQFFQTLDPKAENVFEPLLFESLAKQAWRCAWLEESLEPGPQARGAEAEVAQRLDAYESLLPAQSAEEFVAYEAELVELAASENTTPEALEFANDCGGF